MAVGGVSGKISMVLDDLSPQLRQAALFVSTNPTQVAMHSLRSVARRAQVAPPTLSRLARAAGFKNYEQLRNHCRQEVQDRQASFAAKVAALQADKPADENSRSATAFFSTQLKTSGMNIQALLIDTDVDQLGAATERLSNSHRVFVAASLGASGFAHYFSYMAQMAFGERFVALTTDPASRPGFPSIGRRDALLALTHQPYSQRTVKLSQVAADAGAYVLGITDSTLSPLAKVADHVFLMNTSGQQFFPSYVATLAFLEVLMALLVRSGNKGTARHVAKTENTNWKLGEYWNDPEHRPAI